MIDQEIQRRMDAYRGNPQALAQRYQQNKQLIDLLALQKLKSEKEAAARSLQMAAAQGQGEPPTVAQQREQEVMGLTQQEIAKQIGDTAQQRASEERNMMARLMSGLATAPGAENAMPERAMAAGGIVAFQSGGYTDMIRRQQAEKGSIFGPSFSTTAEQEAQEQLLIKEMTLSELQEYNRSGKKVIPERLKQRFGGFPADLETGVRARVGDGAKNLSAAEFGQDTTQGLAAGVQRDYTPIAPVSDSSAEPVEAPEPVRVSPSILRNLAPPAAAPAADATEAAEADAEKAIADRFAGLASIRPPAKPSIGAVERPGVPSITPAIEAAILKQITDDPMAMARARQAMIPGLNPERMAARQKGIAEAEARFARDYDPRQQSMDRLIAFLIGAGGRTSAAGALGAGGAGALNLGAQQRAAEGKSAKELEAMREGLRALEEGRELESAKAGLAGLEAGEQSRRAGVTAGAGLAGEQARTAGTMYGADVGAASSRYASELSADTSRYVGELNAAVSQLNEQSRALDRAMARKDLDLRTAQTQYGMLSTKRDQLRTAAEKQLDASKPMDIKILESKTNKTAEDLAKLQRYENSRDMAIDRALAETDTALAAIKAKLGIKDTPRAATGVNLPSASAIAEELRRRGAQ